ncbi:uncharacterized protein PAC_13763 [Phialocephala subalpina]|uniref:Uncharacterized protein n=1 Tax=Phialocephala subalpina TaxID=576137 RepID=A0A1L7XFY2_9HELO|nr:uncharacterized protein PAC_13763 [Phialocephala subalpina]
MTYGTSSTPCQFLVHVSWRLNPLVEAKTGVGFRHAILLQPSKSAENPLALKHYAFCHSDKMRVYLNPSIDTLYFGPFGNEFAFMEFISYVKADDKKSLKKLAIHEMHLATWRLELYWTDSRTTGGFASNILGGLERLMIGVEVESEGYPNTAKLRPDNWPGWLFGGGPRTIEEDETLTGSNPRLVMSAHSWDAHLFHIGNDINGAAYSDSLPFAAAVDGYPKHKLLKYYYPPDPDRLGLRKQGQPRPLGGIYDDVISWYRTVYRAVARADDRVKKIFEMQKREDSGNLEA